MLHAFNKIIETVRFVHDLRERPLVVGVQWILVRPFSLQIRLAHILKQQDEMSDMNMDELKCK